VVALKNIVCVEGFSAIYSWSVNLAINYRLVARYLSSRSLPFTVMFQLLV